MLGEDDPTRRWCQEARVLLKLAQAVAPLDSDDLGPAPELTELADAALKLKTSFQARFGGNPTGATEAQIDRLRQVRTLFSGTYSGSPNADKLEMINVVFRKMVSLYALELALCAKRKAVSEQLAAVAPAGTKGTALVPGAGDEDTKTLESLRDKALAALAKADSVAEVEATAGDVEAVAAERDAVALVVETRSKQAERIKAEAEAMQPLPEAPLDSLKAERGAVLLELAPPLSDPALARAEAALLTLRSVCALAEQEALALRQMRLVFTAELKKQRERAQALEVSLGQKSKGPALKILEDLRKLEPKLAVTAGRPLTETFPPALDAVKSDIMGLIMNMTGSGNGTAIAAAAQYMFAELDRCAAEAKDLPQLDDDSIAAAAEVAKTIKLARQLLGVGSGGQAAKARPQVEECTRLICQWRKDVGVAGIVLGQRKAALVKLLEPVNPPDADPEFAVELDAVRKLVNDSLAKKLLEVNVAEAEDHAKPFSALLKKATDDAAAARRATAARLVLATEFAGTLGAARPAARTELTKAKVSADARATLSGMDRDMTQTAKILEDLVARMKAVAAEGSFADTPAAPFADLAEGVRELAFTVCGPALITSLDKGAKQALSAVLVSDGPAIRQLVEGPLGGNPKILAKMLASCGAGGLASLARALGGDGGAAARVTLEGLIDKSGLGGSPEILSRLLGDAPKPGDSAEVTLAKQQAQTRNAAGLKSLAENFSGDEGQAAMGALMLDGGLATSPGALASLMQDSGFAGDGVKMRAFADAFVGDSAGLKRIVISGGVAEHPAVLGPLAKRAGAVGVKSIGAAFVQPADCARLKGLLDSGGMSGDTSQPGHEHEHPDTLTKVFVDGLEGKGEYLKAYAKAFGGPDGPADSKRMLDGFNEYGEDHKDKRQPGKGMALLLGGNQLKGTPEQRIAKLATQFVPAIKEVNPVAQRNRAIRMAPHMAVETAQEGWKATSQAMTDQGIDTITASVLRRHKPEAFALAKVNDVQSMFAPGTDVGDLFDQAMRKITANRGAKQTVTVTASPPPTVISVEVGFLNATTVNHFGPRGGVVTPHPQETPLFTEDEIKSIFKAIK